MTFIELISFGHLQVRHQLDTRNFERYPPDRDIPPDEFSGWDIDF